MLNTLEVMYPYSFTPKPPMIMLPAQLAIVAAKKPFLYLVSTPNSAGSVIPKIPDNTAENTAAAESGIRDTDMAEEMVEYSTNNILAQAGQSMLAQANQNKQGILALLQ